MSDLPYARIDVPVDATTIGTGSYLRLGGYTESPDKTIIDKFGDVVVQRSVSKSTVIDPQTYAKDNNTTTNAKSSIKVTSTTVKPETAGILLKTDKAAYLSVDDAMLSRVGYYSMDVTKGDALVEVKDGAFYASGEQGVAIIAGSTTTPANLVLQASGYIKQTANGPVDQTTYGNKTSYVDGEQKSYVKGYQYSENNGTKESLVNGNNISVVNGSDKSQKWGDKSEVVGGATCSVNLGIAFKFVAGMDSKVVIGMDMKIVVDLDMKIATNDIKIANLDFKMVNADGKVALTNTEVKTIKTKTEALKTAFEGSLIRQGLVQLGQHGINTMAGGLNVFA